MHGRMDHLTACSGVGAAIGHVASIPVHELGPLHGWRGHVGHGYALFPQFLFLLALCDKTLDISNTKLWPLRAESIGIPIARANRYGNRLLKMQSFNWMKLETGTQRIISQQDGHNVIFLIVIIKYEAIHSFWQLFRQKL